MWLRKLLVCLNRWIITVGYFFYKKDENTVDKIMSKIKNLLFSRIYNCQIDFKSGPGKQIWF